MKCEPNASQKTQLEAMLSKHGWKVVAREVDNLDWWADEQWTIESEWSPRGFRLFLTFLVDPQAGDPRLKGSDVWALVATAEAPITRLTDGPTIQIRNQWGKELPAFMTRLTKLRTGE